MENRDENDSDVLAYIQPIKTRWVKIDMPEAVKDIASRGSYIHPRFINDYLKGSFFRLWKDTLGEQMYPLSESESHVIRYLENS